MKKNYILDTNVILHDCNSVMQFEDNTVIIPMTVIEEMDHFKKEMNELGRNARHFSNLMDDLRAQGNLAQGVELPKGGMLKVEFCTSVAMATLPSEMSMEIADNRILAIAKYVQNKSSSPTVLVSKDTNLRIKADALDIVAESYNHGAVSVDDMYTGTGIIDVAPEVIEHIYSHGKVDATIIDLPEGTCPNQYFTLRNMYCTKQSALVRYNSTMQELVLLDHELKAFGITPKNSEQAFALDMMLNPDIQLVTAVGKSGSGKTLMALCAGLHGVIETKQYTKVLLLKPIVAMGNSHQLGFLPGSMAEKLEPWMASYYDNLDFIMGTPKEDTPVASKKRSRKAEIIEDKFCAKVTPSQELIAHGFIELGSLEHIRGRSLPNLYIVCDEIQNMTPAAIKTVLTRAGEGTKIVLMGDVEQIDSPYLSSDNNALTYVADRFKEETLSGHVLLTKTERSKLSEKAAELL